MNSLRINDWIRPAVKQMSAYPVADATGMLKLDAMENPYLLPRELHQQWLAELDQSSLNRYPDPAATTLKQIMRQALDIPDDKGLILGNGSDEIILMLAQALGGKGRCFLSVEPTFVMYRMIAAMNGLAYEGVSLQAQDFSLNLDLTIKAIQDKQPAVVFIANPNNPTGNIHDLDTLREIARVCPGLLVIDEAYAPFTDISATSLVDEFNHVLVMRTLSKMGLAGLRLGYLFGNREWIDELEKVRLPYNINTLSQISAAFALKNKIVFDEQARLICLSRQRLLDDLNQLEGLTAWPSEANFILFRVEQGGAGKVFAALKQKHILIKSLDGGHPLLKACLRVTVGSEPENATFIQSMVEIMAEGVD